MTDAITIQTARLQIRPLPFRHEPVRSATDTSTFGLFRSNDETKVGTIRISPIRQAEVRSAKIDCEIDPLFGRQGYATEAFPAMLTLSFKTLDYQQVVAMMDPDNEPALVVASRAGLPFRSSVSYGPSSQQLTFVYRPSDDLSPAVGFDRTAVSRLRQAKQYHAAKAVVASYLNQAPDDPQIHYQMAWCHDNLGEEAAAVPHYVAAIEQGLAAPDLQEAYVGLGSTYRALGRYDDAYRTLTEGLAHFPQHAVLQTFLALTLHNLDRSAEAIERLIGTLVDTTGNPEIHAYARALRFYASRVDETWDGN
ncbi:MULTISPECIES: tetratricopeptide repeat protein [Exiguobacterium]|uniref:tetratricopeptide repeat protein n=1 Tax=Exiguobacterium TaxID=33986 RepID=UPI001BE6F044|nr:MULTISPECIES: tetratricopeptide repeat protein [Exiguobacterium]MCT4790979.1 tetratricopeptide repeat protein [Exiguobacterium artemiae]